MVQNGVSSYYGKGFNGRKTASGTIFRKSAMTAAHRTLPFGTKVRVTDKDTGKSVVVKITDRGPFHANRILDLSEGAAKRLGITKKGTCDVKLQVISVGDGEYQTTKRSKHFRRYSGQRDLIAELIKTRHLSNS
jgi:rare lipoprotein A